MDYYKILSGSRIVGASSTNGLRKWQRKYSRVVAARGADDASMIACEYPEDDLALYRDGWMIQHVEADRLAVAAEVVEITGEEYDRLAEELTLGEPVEENEPEETEQQEPEEISGLTKTDMLEMLADMEMRISMLELGVAIV